MEKLNLSFKNNVSLQSCKYLILASLFFVLHSCVKDNLNTEKKSFSKSLFLDNKIEKYSGVCNIDNIGSISNIYIKEGDYNKAIQILLSAKDSLLKLNDNSQLNELFVIYDNLGNLYGCIKEKDLSIDCYQQAIHFATKNGNQRNVLFGLNNLSTTYLNIENYNEAVGLLTKAYNILQENYKILSEDFYLKYLIFLNLSNAYIGLGKFDLAKPYFLQAKEIIEKNKFSFYEKASIITSEADFFIHEKQYEKAFSLYEEALVLYRENGDLDGEQWTLLAMKNLAKNINDYHLAYNYQEDQYKIIDIIRSQEKEKERLKLETHYKTKDLERENEKKQIELNVQKQKNKLALGGVAAALVLALGATGFGYVVRKKNQIITTKNDALHDANQELQVLNNIVTQNNKQLQSQQDSIEASIKYASRIQKSILFNDIQKHFPRSFVFSRPRDIVGGDFYFSADTLNGKKMLAVGDCTGHGVPSALLTIFGNVHIKKLLETSQQPSDIISGLDKLFIDQYNQEKSYNSDNILTSDSMDIACLFYDPQNAILEYSVSSRPILLLRNGELTRLGTDFPVDVGLETKPSSFSGFITYQEQLQPGDEIFLSSDGVSDQFVGKTGRKLGSTAFNDFLKKLSNIPVAERSSYTQRFYSDIMKKSDGNQCDQVDDMLLVGFVV